MDMAATLAARRAGRQIREMRRPDHGTGGTTRWPSAGGSGRRERRGRGPRAGGRAAGDIEGAQALAREALDAARVEELFGAPYVDPERIAALRATMARLDGG